MHESAWWETFILALSKTCWCVGMLFDFLYIVSAKKSTGNFNSHRNKYVVEKNLSENLLKMFVFPMFSAQQEEKAFPPELCTFRLL